MSKIIITDDSIKLDNISDNIKIEVNDQKSELISKIDIDALNDEILEIEYNIIDNRKVSFNININDNISFKIIDKKVGNNIKSKYQYKLNKGSNLIINKINDCTNIKEYDVTNLNGEGATLKYVLKTISRTNEHYDIIVNHNAKETNSDVITNGINIDDGSLILNVTGEVPRGMSGCNVNQNNRIINLNKNKCQINPNLLIDEMNCFANHSAHISAFDDDDLFYLGIRGINKVDASKLLIKGYLMSELLESVNEYINNLMKKYWG